MGKSTTRFAVQCNKHGTTVRDLWKAVFTSPPANAGSGKKQGCPVCKVEASREVATATLAAAAIAAKA